MLYIALRRVFHRSHIGPLAHVTIINYGTIENIFIVIRTSYFTVISY